MSEEKPLTSIPEIQKAFAESVEAEKRYMQDNKIGIVLGYLAKAIHDLQEAGIDVELLDMRADSSEKNKEDGQSLYKASLRLGNQTLPLTLYSKKIREGVGEYHRYKYTGDGYYDSYKDYSVIRINVPGIADRAFGYKEEEPVVYQNLMDDLIRAAARQEVLHRMDEKSVFNVPSVLRSEETKRKAAMPPRPTLGGNNP